LNFPLEIQLSCPLADTNAPIEKDNTRATRDNLDLKYGTNARHRRMEAAFHAPPRNATR
jgi:hypothetical protein